MWIDYFYTNVKKLFNMWIDYCCEYRHIDPLLLMFFHLFGNIFIFSYFIFRVLSNCEIDFMKRKMKEPHAQY